MKLLITAIALLTLTGCVNLRGNGPIMQAIGRSYDAQDPCQGRSPQTRPDFCGANHARTRITDRYGRTLGYVER